MMLFGHNPFGSQLLFHSLQVGGVRVAERSGSSVESCFVVNPIPHNLVVQSCGHTPTDCESQFSIEAFFKQLQHLVALRAIWQVTCPRSSGNIHSIPITAVKIVGNDNCARRMPVAIHFWVHSHPHFAFGHVPYHFAENGGTHGALYPFFVPQHALEAVLMVDMGAGQGIDVLVRGGHNLFLHVLDFEVLLADGALFFVHFALAQHKLDGGEELDVELRVKD